jgi:hypothetical protein
MKHVKAVAKDVPVEASILDWWGEITTPDPVLSPKEVWFTSRW